MLKNTLINQGENSIHALNRIFKKADKHKTNCLSRNEFAWVVKEAGFSLTKTELDNIFRFFDKNCDDKVDYSEFLSFLRQDLNENRLVIVKKAWEKLDKKNEGKIGVEELKTYNPIVRVDVKFIILYKFFIK